MEPNVLRYVNKLDIESFIHMLDDPTECYKFYWLDALLKLFSRGDTQITFDDIINVMIAGAWYSVVEYHLHLGPKNSNGKVMNSLERAVIKLEELSQLPHDADENTIIAAIKKYDAGIADEKKQLILNVPYRILSSFMHEIGGNDKLWDQRKRLIAYIEGLNRLKCLPYHIVDGVTLNKKVVINEEWWQFLSDNYVTISGWIDVKKVRYLQGRNPGVPGIIYKLAPENDKQRKLKYVRELWNAVLDVSEIKDIYTNKPFERNGFAVDHFIPWSFVANDELWNLIPMDSSLNSSKSNYLPDWNKYFESFAGNQYSMYQNVIKYNKIHDAFDKCQRDNLVMPWSLEELYTPECDRSSFYCVLEKNLKNVYDSARMQGYEIWKN